MNRQRNSYPSPTNSYSSFAIRSKTSYWGNLYDIAHFTKTFWITSKSCFSWSVRIMFCSIVMSSKRSIWMWDPKCLGMWFYFNFEIAVKSKHSRKTLKGWLYGLYLFINFFFNIGNLLRIVYRNLKLIHSLLLYFFF